MNRGLIDPWLVLGSALYWSAAVLSLSFGGVSVSPTASPSGVVAAYAWVAAIIACFLPARSLFEHRRTRRGTALVMASVVVLYVVACALPQTPGAVRLIASRAYLVEVACQMVLWGFAYASFDKSRACQNVCCTVLVTGVVVCLVSLAFKFTHVPYLTCFLNVAALAVVASDRVFFCGHAREPKPGARRSLASFLVTRIAFGAYVGFCMQLPGSSSIPAGSTPMTVLACVLCAGMLLAHLCLHTRVTAFMPAALVIVVCLLFLPHLDGGTTSLVSSAAGFTWLAWASMSAAQLSELKETFGMREFTLCVAEKGLLSLAIMAGSAACLAFGTFGGSASAVEIQVVVVGGLTVLVFIAALTMSRLLDDRRRDELLRRLEEENRELAGELYGRLAAEYRLSEREGQIMALLAEGYSRTHIRDALGISEGTVKAHVAHLYQKMGIHRKDELLDIMEAHR